MDTPPLPDAPASTAAAPVLPPAVRAAADDLARLLADPTSASGALRTAALALVAALDAATDGTSHGQRDGPFRRAGFDPDVLAQLFALTGPEVARDLLLRLAEDLQSARTALAPEGPSPPPQVLRAQAHVLVGLGGSVGAARVHEAARHLGEACRAGTDAALLDRLRAEVVAAIDAALAFLADQGPGLPARLAAGP